MRINTIGATIPISSPVHATPWRLDKLIELSVDELFDRTDPAIHEEICQLGDGYDGSYCGDVLLREVGAKSGLAYYVVADSEGWALLQQALQLDVVGPHLLDTYHLQLAIQTQIAMRLHLMIGDI